MIELIYNISLPLTALLDKVQFSNRLGLCMCVCSPVPEQTANRRYRWQGGSVVHVKIKQSYQRNIFREN